MRPCPCPGLLDTSLQKHFSCIMALLACMTTGQIAKSVSRICRCKTRGDACDIKVRLWEVRFWVCYLPVLSQEHQQVPEIDGRVALGPLVAVQDFLEAPCDHEVAELDDLLQALLQKCDGPRSRLFARFQDTKPRVGVTTIWSADMCTWITFHPCYNLTDPKTSPKSDNVAFHAKSAPPLEAESFAKSTGHSRAAHLHACDVSPGRKVGEREHVVVQPEEGIQVVGRHLLRQQHAHQQLAHQLHQRPPDLLVGPPRDALGHPAQDLLQGPASPAQPHNHHMTVHMHCSFVNRLSELR